MRESESEPERMRVRLRVGATDINEISIEERVQGMISAPSMFLGLSGG